MEKGRRVAQKSMARAGVEVGNRRAARAPRSEAEAAIDKVTAIKRGAPVPA